MTRRCEHCATPFAEGRGVGDFCCAGCQQVHELIRAEGLDDFYRWQDRAAEPLKDRALSVPDAQRLAATQARVEATGPRPRAAFRVEGMSCLGCAWLVERLALKQAGVLQCACSLSDQRVVLAWHPGLFQLSAWAGELLRFGYSLQPEPVADLRGARFAPRWLRALFCALFTLNVALLLVASRFFPAAPLVDLLGLASLVFALILGLGPAAMTVTRSLRIHRWHRDGLYLIPVAGAGLLGGFLVLAGGASLLLAILLVALAATLSAGLRAALGRS
jgi:Cu2+-exporting ATPase